HLSLPRPHRLAMVGLLAALLAIVTVGPALHGQPAPHFRSASNDLVVVSATVLDKEGGFVEGLDLGRFALFEDGKRQRIDVFHSEDIPSSVGVIIDNSASMGPKIGEVVAATIAFAKSSH